MSFNERRMKTVRIALPSFTMIDLTTLILGIRAVVPDAQIIDIRKNYAYMDSNGEDYLVGVYSSSFPEIEPGVRLPELEVPTDIHMVDRALDFLNGTLSKTIPVIDNKINKIEKPACNCEMEYLVGGITIHRKGCASLRTE